MKIVGLLSWFREQPSKLHRTITSTAPLLDELVCLDGRYALFPHSENRSTQDEIKAIQDACGTARLPVHIHQVDEPFDGKWGGEVAKRASLFQLGARTGADWFYVFDADTVVQDIRPGWREMLEAERDLNVGTVMVADRGLAHPHPMFFRALPGLTVRERHWRYLVPGGPVLWDYPAFITQRKRIPTFTKVIVEHEAHDRDTERAKARAHYYELRDRHRIETEPVRSVTAPQDTLRAAHMLRRALSRGAGETPGGGHTESRR